MHKGSQLSGLAVFVLRLLLLQAVQWMQGMTEGDQRLSYGKADSSCSEDDSSSDAVSSGESDGEEDLAAVHTALRLWSIGRR